MIKERLINKTIPYTFLLTPVVITPFWPDLYIVKRVTIYIPAGEQSDPEDLLQRMQNNLKVIKGISDVPTKGHNENFYFRSNPQNT